MIRIEHLCRSFGSRVAVDDISFAIPAGETFGLLGPNGAGKSTTIKLLVGALLPDRGAVEIAGQRDPTRPAARQAIGVAPQDCAFYDDLTAAENLRFFGALYGLAGARLKERVAWSLDFVGLTERAADLAKNYSGGMKRRLNLAIALIQDPRVILLDEPTVGVDPQSRHHLFVNIERLKSTGKTILYTTHYMEEAQRLCERVAIMDHGKLLALDTVERLIAEHGGSAVVEVEFAAGEIPPAEIGVVDGNCWRVDTSEPDRVLSQLLAGGRCFAAVRIHRPDLESVFLNLTGRRLRD